MPGEPGTTDCYETDEELELALGNTEGTTDKAAPDFVLLELFEHQNFEGRRRVITGTGPCVPGIVSLRQACMTWGEPRAIVARVKAGPLVQRGILDLQRRDIERGLAGDDTEGNDRTARPSQGQLSVRREENGERFIEVRADRQVSVFVASREAEALEGQLVRVVTNPKGKVQFVRAERDRDRGS